MALKGDERSGSSARLAGYLWRLSNPSVEIFHQHQIATGRFDLRVQKPTAVWGNRKAIYRSLRNLDDLRDFPGCKIQELHRRVLPFWDEIHPFIDDREIEPGNRVENSSFFPAFDRGFPETRDISRRLSSL